MSKNIDINKGLFDFIRTSPTAFHAVASITQILDDSGFEKLSETDSWSLASDGKYYVVRNDSSIIAFRLGNNPEGFRIAASHSDSPCFKIKEKSEITVRDKYIKLNTEGYGGMICYSWMDRPLSLAGRVVIREGESLCSRLVNIDEDTLIIPSLAIHMNRKVNSGVEFNLQTDMLPLFADNGRKIADVNELIADKLGISSDQIYGKDIFLYNRAKGTYIGANGEFIGAPRIDDLQCAYASLRAFVDSNNDGTISMYACFDNEEVGSSTLQGAASTFLSDTINRICDGLAIGAEDYHRMMARSFMLSEDNGHAVHPNHTEKTDVDNCVYMNGGIVIKSHAGAKYTTDGYGVAICRNICEQIGIPYQFFVNRSDEAGGSTLGNLASCRVPVKTVDIGLAQLAMHSSYETAGADDTDYMMRFTQAFYEDANI